VISNSLLIIIFLVSITTSTLAEVTTGVEEETDLRFWSWERRGISLQLTQRTPDQTEAFFIGRGFSSEKSKMVGESCVFQAVFRNSSNDHLEYSLEHWDVIYKQEIMMPLHRNYWEQRWIEESVSNASRIAFRWSLLPTVQRFEPGDYNWGMISFGLNPGAEFDLSIRMKHGDKVVTEKLAGMQCAERDESNG